MTCCRKNTEIKIKMAPGCEDLTPVRATSGSSGFDLEANLPARTKLESGKPLLIPTGVFLELPLGFEAQIRPRSGLALKYGITVLNSPGTIDSDYRGEICVLLINNGKEAQFIARGDRIAQLVIAPVYMGDLTLVTEIKDTERGEGGFGSSGT